MRQTLSCLHCTESSAEAVEERQPGHYLSSDWFLFPMPSLCARLLPGHFLPVGACCCRSRWGFTTARFARGSSDSPAEGSSQLAVCCGPECAAPEAKG